MYVVASAVWASRDYESHSRAARSMLATLSHFLSLSFNQAILDLAQRHQKMWPLQISGHIIQCDDIFLYCTLLRFITWEVHSQKSYVCLKRSKRDPNRLKGFTHLKQSCTAAQCKRDSKWGKTVVKVQCNEIFASCFILLKIWRGHIAGQRCARSSTAWMKDRHLAKNVLYRLLSDRQKRVLCALLFK